MTKKIDLVLLAGGRGSRIKDYLKSYPKPMINVNGNRFLFLLLKYFSKYVYRKYIYSCGCTEDKK